MSVLHRLARAVGVAVTYDASGGTRTAPDATLRGILTELGHPCEDDATVVRSLRAVRRQAWTRDIDPVAVVWRGGGATGPCHVTLSAAEAATPRCELTLQDGTTRDLGNAVWGGVAETPDGPRRRGRVALPTDLPLGYHRLLLTAGPRDAAEPEPDETGVTTRPTCTVIVAPDRVPTAGTSRRWGWMLQAYAVRSEASWGQGEFADLATLATWAAEDGADFLLINPVHASAPVRAQQASPYSPTSRRFVNPCYLRVTAVDGFDDVATPQLRALMPLPDALAADTDRIDRDTVWRVKRAALWEVYAAHERDARDRLREYRVAGGTALQRFAVFCALAEEHGDDFTSWPPALRDPRSAGVLRWAADHDELVGFHAWLQQLCHEQLGAAQAAARDAGMAIGVIHDLAVGVTPGGADVWALPDEFVRSMRVGAPPDAFNQKGQNWGQPPPLPQAMRATGYRSQREVLTASLAAGGGLRIDHILGLSRLFWIPAGGDPADGTYVRYPAEELIAVLAVEAQRFGAVVIGEDLGTVDDRIRRLMRERGVLGSAVLWFERDGATTHGHRPAARYPRAALASVTTHDLPTATGFWDGSALDVRAELDLLAEPLATAEAELADDREALLALLRQHHALPGEGTDVRSRVVAMHRFLASTPTVLVAPALWDGVGDPRQPNVPGTVDEYPNWRLPLAEPAPGGARPVTVDRLVSTGIVDDIVAAIRDGRSPT